MSNNVEQNKSSGIVDKLLNYYMAQKNFEQEVGDYLRSQTSSPKLYSNDLRHQYASAITAQQLGPGIAKFLGDFNEFTDLNQSGNEDTEIDKYNNRIGREYALKYPNYTKQQYLDAFFNNRQAIKNQRLKELGY